jgi:3-hydroxyisobutyrate dehydrogenase
MDDGDNASQPDGVAGGPSVGVIGLGDIGAGVAASVAAAGLPLAVCDVRDEATDRFAETATIAASPAELAKVSDVIVVAVVNDAQVRAVLTGPDGALAAARPSASVIVVSTISPATVEEVAAEASAAGVGIIDCGVSGGPSSAASGELICMVGGDEATVDRVRPVLDAMSVLVVRTGPLGSGLVAKLARNIVQYGSWLAAYEAQRLAEAAGIDLAKLASVIRASDAKIGGAATLMFRQTVAPFGPDDDEGIVQAMRAAAALAHKDLRAALAVGTGLGLDLPVAALTEAHCDDVFGMGTAEEGT